MVPHLGRVLDGKEILRDVQGTALPLRTKTATCGMTYRTEEFRQVLDRTKFANNYALAKVKLAGLQVWLITLSKVSTPVNE